MTPTLTTALVLHASGISAVPVNTEKIPLVKWKKYITELPTTAELERWFSKGAGIALVAGRVQCLDFDEKYSAGIFQRYCKRAEEVGLDQIIGGLCLQKTPTGGFHFVWQCDGAQIGNTKLASKVNKETMIETRGDGGYFLIAPSDKYAMVAGDWSSIPVIGEDDRDAMLNLARTFDEKPAVEAHPEPAQHPAMTSTSVQISRLCSSSTAGSLQDRPASIGLAQARQKASARPGMSYQGVFSCSRARLSLTSIMFTGLGTFTPCSNAGATTAGRRRSSGAKDSAALRRRRPAKRCQLTGILRLSTAKTNRLQLRVWIPPVTLRPSKPLTTRSGVC